MKRCNARHRQTFYNLGMFLSPTLKPSVFMGKNYSENLHSTQNTGPDLTLKQVFDISEKLKVESMSQISWEKSTLKLSLVNDEEVISLSHATVCVFFRFCVMSWKSESEPSIKYCLGRTVELVQRFSKIQNFGQLTESGWNSSGIFSQNSPHCRSSTMSKSS